jgi:hypothetical protein
MANIETLVCVCLILSSIQQNGTNGLVVMCATAGLMAGTQIFRQEDSEEFYPNGLLIMIGLVLMGLILTALQEVIYYVQNRRAEKRGSFAELNIL